MDDVRVSAPALSELMQAATDFPAELIAKQHNIVVRGGEAPHPTCWMCCWEVVLEVE